MTIAGMANTERHVDVTFDDGKTMRFMSPWLRNNISSGRHRLDGQWTFDINSLPQPRIAAANHSGHSVTIRFTPQGPMEEFSKEFLRKKGGAGSLTYVDYNSLPTDRRALHDCLTDLRDV